MSTEAASPPNHKTNNDRSALKAGAARVIKWVGRLSLLVFFGGVLIVPAVHLVEYRGLVLRYLGNQPVCRHRR